MHIPLERYGSDWSHPQMCSQHPVNPVVSAFAWAVNATNAGTAPCQGGAGSCDVYIQTTTSTPPDPPSTLYYGACFNAPPPSPKGQCYTNTCPYVYTPKYYILRTMSVCVRARVCVYSSSPHMPVQSVGDRSSHDSSGIFTFMNIYLRRYSTYTICILFFIIIISFRIQFTIVLQLVRTILFSILTSFIPSSPPPPLPFCNTKHLQAATR